MKGVVSFKGRWQIGGRRGRESMDGRLAAVFGKRLEMADKRTRDTRRQGFISSSTFSALATLIGIDNFSTVSDQARKELIAITCVRMVPPRILRK